MYKMEKNSSTVNGVYLERPIESKKLTKLQNDKVLRKNKWWLRKDNGYVMSLSDRRTKYGYCG